MTETDPAATEWLRASMPFAATLGVEAIELSARLVRAQLVWNETRCTAGGVLHGGVVMALADTCGGACAFANLPDGATGTATITSSTNFVRAVRGGTLTATSTPLHIGRGTIVVETELRDDTGQLVAKVTQTQAVLGP